jgi:hypothetical protein
VRGDDGDALQKPSLPDISGVARSSTVEQLGTERLHLARSRYISALCYREHWRELQRTFPRRGSIALSRCVPFI